MKANNNRPLDWTTIEQIKAEIEWLINDKTDGKHVAEADITAPKRSAYLDILNFINSLPVEQPSEDLEEYYTKDFLPKEWFAKQGQRTLSEFNFFTAKHFANWQKEQDINKACKWLVDNANGSIYYDDTDNAFIDTDELVTNLKEAMEKEDK